MIYIRDCMLKQPEGTPIPGKEPLPSDEQIAAAVEPVVTALGGVEEINSRLKGILPRSALKEARQILASNHIEYTSEDSKWLPAWKSGDMFLDVKLMVVSRKNHVIFKPGIRLGVFNPLDYLQVRKDFAGALIGAYLIKMDLQKEAKWLEEKNFWDLIDPESVADPEARKRIEPIIADRTKKRDDLLQELKQFQPLSGIAPDTGKMRQIVAQVISSEPNLFMGEGELIGRRVGFALPQQTAGQVGEPAGYWVEGEVTEHDLLRNATLGGVLTVKLPLIDKPVTVGRDAVRLFSPLSPYISPPAR